MPLGTILPDEIIHNILGHIDEPRHRALKAVMPVSPQFLDIARSHAWREMQLEPCTVDIHAEKIKPEIARHVRELYIESETRICKSWLGDSSKLGFCLHHNFPKLKKLSLDFVTWTSLSLANQIRLHELTQSPCFQDFRALGVTDMPLSLIAGLRTLKHLDASSITMSKQPVSLAPFTGRRTHLETLSLAFVPGERNDASWVSQVQGLVTLLDFILSTASPISLTGLRGLSINTRLVTVLRPGLCRALEDCSATLECLKIRAGCNFVTQGGLIGTNEPLDLGRHTILKSILVHFEFFEDDVLDWLINTLATLDPSTPLKDLTICVNHHPATRRLRKSDKWAYLDNILSRLRSCSLRRVQFVVLVGPSGFCACVQGKHCRQCTRERKFGKAIATSLPRSAGTVSVVKIQDKYIDTLPVLFSVTEAKSDHIWEDARHVGAEPNT
ncbi:hypothetical protein FPV67DRAFT_1673641 [Lyophyllum atratum]|nr:hypothetical protein FPV67DRAFT_1673641 [Lyophyllum atratum]